MTSWIQTVDATLGITLWSSGSIQGTESPIGVTSDLTANSEA